MLQRILLVAAGILAVALAVVLITGGGGDRDETTTTANDGTEAKAPEKNECEEKGISVAPRNEGTCTDGGTTYNVVNRDGVLELSNLEAKLLDLRKAKAISSGSGESTAAKERTYAIFELSITNRGDAPATFEEGQTVVFVNGALYRPGVKLQKNEEESFLSQNASIQPEDTQVGTVTFNMWIKDFEELERKDGNLDMVEFGSKGEVLQQEEVGTIRLYQ